MRALFFLLALAARVTARIDSLAVTLSTVMDRASLSRRAPQSAVVDISHHAVDLGARNAPVLIVAFEDYECPFCAKFNSELFPQLADHYVKNGKVRVVKMDLPLKMHKHALDAAVVARCAGVQSSRKYWGFRKAVYERNDS